MSKTFTHTIVTKGYISDVMADIAYRHFDADPKYFRAINYRQGGGDIGFSEKASFAVRNQEE